jgi:2-dehydropantoate 2-reductase
MKIAILGAGAMGSAIGALLAQAGNDVTLIDVWKQAVETINRDGLKVQNKAGEVTVHKIKAVTSPAMVTGPVDLVLVFVKCYHTAEAVKSAASLIGSNTTVLSLQNGWGNGPRIAKIVGQEKVLLGVCYHSATVLGPGHVQHAGQGKTFIGELDGSHTPRLRTIVQVFNEAGVTVEPSDQVLREIWSKLALNAATLPTSASIRITADHLCDTEAMQNLMQELLKEVVAVANAQKIPLEFDERWEAITGLLKKLAPNSKPSMLQDVERQRCTEIDVINGAIVEAGQRLGIRTPCNQAMVWLIKALEGANPREGGLPPPP